MEGPWVDPRERTMDDLWAAADGACRFRFEAYGFLGVQANLTGRGGWNATAMGGDAYGLPGKYIGGWGPTPRMAIGNFILNMLHEPKVLHEKPWWES